MNKIILYWPIAYSGNGSTPFSVGWDLEKTGWKTFVSSKILPAIAWAEQQKLKYTILLMHPFNQYNGSNEAMHLDGYDLSKRLERKKLTTGFTSAFKNLACPKVAYLGGMELTPRLKNLPPRQKPVAIYRNVQSIWNSGFERIFLDYAENAITYPFKSPNPVQSAPRSCDAFTLAYLDELFPKLTGIEAAPRAFPQFSHLWNRDIIMQDTVYQHRYGGLNNWRDYEQEFNYGPRHGSYVELGYDRSVLKGEIWRTLPYSDNLNAIRALATNIWNQGDVPAICPAPFMNRNEVILSSYH